MSQYDKNNDDKKNRIAGLFTTILVNTCFLLILLFTMGVAEPKPQITVIALEIEPDKETPEPVTPPPPLQSRPAQVLTNKPQQRTSSSAKPDVAEPKPTALSMVDETGDMDIPENPKPVDTRSLYQSNDNGTLTAQTVGQNPQAQYADNSKGLGNNREGDSFARVEGRNLAEGYKLSEPENKSNKEGRVVVEIRVSQSGKVISAKAVTKGSTVQDASLWKAAEEAAMKAVFNTDNRAPAVQTGTITYIFKLR
jgi:TonB family protein